jgi:mono/diheme cytochrome c family protein
MRFLPGWGRWHALIVVAAALPLGLAAQVSGLHWAVALVLIVVVAAVAVRLLTLRRGEESVPPSLVRTGLVAAASLVLVGAVIQAVPYGWSRDNPQVTAEPVWDTVRTRELAVRACFDCHSNEVEYPWYASVAPISWAVERHVDAGRDVLNFSEWDRPQREADESIETIEEGSMPPWYYNLTHSSLTDAEKAELIAGLEASGISREEEGERGEGGGEHDEADDEDDDD